MALELKQSLKLSQQLVMTPQLQQAIKLLQLSRTELSDVLAQEMIENPILEDQIDSGRDRDLEQVKTKSESAPELNGVDGPSMETATPKERNDIENATSAEWEQYLGGTYSSGSGLAGGSRDFNNEELPSYEATLSKKSNLYDHLMWQLRLSSFSKEEEAIGALILGNLDDDGYLQDPLEEMAKREGLEFAFVEKVLKRIQEFDPVGVGARNLQECLLLQVKHLAGDFDFDLIENMIQKHIGNLERKNYPAIAKDLQVTLEEVHESAKVISDLEPKPGRPFSSEEPQYITPDIYVHKIGEDFVIVLNDDGLPKLKISNFYKNVLQKEGASAQTKGYVQDKLKSAIWLIKSIQQRQRTIYRVTESIVKFQKEFFDQGIAHLKPMVLRDVAEDIGMHESTISRVTSNKYVHCPQGILELKFFFNSGINRVDGDALASESVKNKIKQLVSAENPKRPLSDQRIVELLKEANIDIARRTVAKYREMLGILSSSKRKRLL
jgi:RNA polymerase sigma-54 factor